MTEKKKPNGAMWKKSNNYGEYLSGEIEINGAKHRFVAYANSYKNADKQPDFRIFLSVPKEVPKWNPPVMNDEDIPF